MTSQTIRLGSIVSRAIHGFSRDRSGLTAVHYGLIAALIALVALPGVKLVGGGASGQLMDIADKVASDSGEGGEGASDSGGAAGGSSSGDSASGGGAPGSGDSADGGGAGNNDGAADNGKKKKKKKKKN